MTAPSVDMVTGSFYRRDKCVVCGKTTERQKTFSADSLPALNKKGAAWTGPLAHKKCEPFYLGEEPL